MPSILLLEDDPALGSGLKLTLEIQGFRVDWEKSIRGALEAIKKQPNDLYLLDWNLPDGSGLEVCEKIRNENPQVPIIFLTARSDEEDAVTALTKGANDFIRKPFGQQELIARIKRALREVEVRDEELRFGELFIKVKSREIYINNAEIPVNRREFDILVFLCRRANTVVSRNEILEKINPDGELFDRTIDSHMSHIRTKIKKQENTKLRLSSVYGIGYKLELSDDAE